MALTFVPCTWKLPSTFEESEPHQGRLLILVSCILTPPWFTIAICWSCHPYFKHTLECNTEEDMITTSYHFIKTNCFFCFLTQAIRSLRKRDMSDTSDLWQIKLILEFFSSRSHQERQQDPKRGLFMNSEFLPVVKCTIDATLDEWLQGMWHSALVLFGYTRLRLLYSSSSHWQTR